jgi:hypothetical protein
LRLVHGARILFRATGCARSIDGEFGDDGHRDSVRGLRCGLIGAHRLRLLGAIEIIEVFDDLDFPRLESNAAQLLEEHDVLPGDRIRSIACGSPAGAQSAEAQPEILQRPWKVWQQQIGFVFGDVFGTVAAGLQGAFQQRFVDFASRAAVLVRCRESEIALRVVSQVLAEASIKDA